MAQSEIKQTIKHIDANVLNFLCVMYNYLDFIRHRYGHCKLNICIKSGRCASKRVRVKPKQRLRTYPINKLANLRAHHFIETVRQQYQCVFYMCAMESSANFIKCYCFGCDCFKYFARITHSLTHRILQVVHGLHASINYIQKSQYNLFRFHSF